MTAAVRRKVTAKKHVVSKNSKLALKEHGGRLNGHGRQKGTPNKVTTEAKRAIALAFEGLGGVDGLIKWAKANKTNKAIFYSTIYPKLIPVQVVGKDDNPIEFRDTTAESILERIIVGIIAERRDGSEALPVVIDAEPDSSAVPQLVLSRKTGTEAA
jgi:hypothetical protein